MKNLILFLFIFGAVAVRAQNKPSLKDLLYSGKLKKDSSGIIRSTDDLSTKIDTSTKKDIQAVKANAPAANSELDKKIVTPKPGINSNVTLNASDIKDSAATIAAPGHGASTMTNTKLWKEYSDSLVKTLKADVLNSKKIKKDIYYLIVDYEIATDGLVTVTNISCTPENAFLQAQVRQLMDSTPLRLNPITDSSNQPKKVKRRQQIAVTKE